MRSVGIILENEVSVRMHVVFWFWTVDTKNVIDWMFLGSLAM